MMNQIYKVYLEDKTNIYSVIVPAKSKKEATEYCRGNGELVKIKDITDDTPISVSSVYDALTSANFGQDEIDIVCRLIQNNLKNTIGW